MESVEYDFSKIHEAVKKDKLLRFIHETGKLQTKEDWSGIMKFEDFKMKLISKSKLSYRKTCNLRTIRVMQPEHYYTDDLTNYNYRVNRVKEYTEEELETMNDDLLPICSLLGLYIKESDRIIIDPTRIKEAAKFLKVKEDELKTVVLYHELGHRFTLHAKPKDKYISNCWFQELSAQLLAFSLINPSEKKVMDILSKNQSKIYNSYKLEGFSNLKGDDDNQKSSLTNLFKINYYIDKTKAEEIGSLKELIKEITSIEPKSDDQFYEDFYNMVNYDVSPIILGIEDLFFE
jgi:hypothetical protein